MSAMAFVSPEMLAIDLSLPPSPLFPHDLFDGALHLEDDFYAEGYELGVADGQRAGRIEGRAFGWDKGFEKSVAMGRLAGRAMVWQSRMANSSTDDSMRNPDDGVPGGENPEDKLRPLRRSERLQKHVARLCETTKFTSLPVQNTEPAVDEFDDRLRDAQARATLITTAAREGNGTQEKNHDNRKINDQDGERPAASRGFRLKRPANTTSGNAEIEDFAGLPRAQNRRGAA